MTCSLLIDNVWGILQNNTSSGIPQDMSHIINIAWIMSPVLDSTNASQKSANLHLQFEKTKQRFCMETWNTEQMVGFTGLTHL